MRKSLSYIGVGMALCAATAPSLLGAQLLTRPVGSVTLSEPNRLAVFTMAATNRDGVQIELSVNYRRKLAGISDRAGAAFCSLEELQDWVDSVETIVGVPALLERPTDQLFFAATCGVGTTISRSIGGKSPGVTLSVFGFGGGDVVRLSKDRVAEVLQLARRAIDETRVLNPPPPIDTVRVMRLSSREYPYGDFELDKKPMLVGERPVLYLPPRRFAVDQKIASIDVELTIDTTGSVEEGSVRYFFDVTDAQRTEIRSQVSSLHYFPGEIDGERVRSVIRETFSVRRTK